MLPLLVSGARRLLCFLKLVLEMTANAIEQDEKYQGWNSEPACSRAADFTAMHTSLYLAQAVGAALPFTEAGQTAKGQGQEGQASAIAGRSQETLTGPHSIF